jgi:hypothetical protein
LFLKSWTKGEMGLSGDTKLPACMLLALLMTESKSCAFQLLRLPWVGEFLDLEKYWCSFCRVGFMLFAIMMSDLGECRLVVEDGEGGSLLDRGLTGHWKGILLLFPLLRNESTDTRRFGAW